MPYIVTVKECQVFQKVDTLVCILHFRTSEILIWTYPVAGMWIGPWWLLLLLCCCCCDSILLEICKHETSNKCQHPIRPCGHLFLTYGDFDPKVFWTKKICTVVTPDIEHIYIHFSCLFSEFLAQTDKMNGRARPISSVIICSDVVNVANCIMCAVCWVSGCSSRPII